MRICLIASSRFPICEPFAGGLEALTHGLAGELTRRGHEVALFAAPGSDPELPVATLDLPTFVPSEAARADVQAQPDLWLNEHHAYLGLMLDLLAGGDSRFDVVHNNSLHHLPVAMAPALTVPMLTTLHTPPVPWLESAVALAPAGSRFAAVSRFTAASWAHATPSVVVLNGVDVGSFPFGPGGGPAVWTGRIVPEKAPHEAIEAARLAGLPLVLAGPIFDRTYFERCVEPLLGGQVSYAGHLGGCDLRRLLGRASVAVVTPNWDEPYGLVAAEAMACGTPVAAYARGALPEVVAPGTGVLSAPGDVSRLAEAMVQALGCDRVTVRAHAERACSLVRMVDEYERLYASLARVHEAA